MLAEDIQGLEEQIVGLRTLERGLMERQAQTGGIDESTRLFETHTLIAGWLDEMLRCEALLAEKSEEGTWADEFLERIDKMCMEKGEILDREALMKEAMGSNLELDLSARHLREEIATLRFLLRNTLGVAEEAQEDKTFVRMAALYGKGSVRLARLLRRKKANEGILASILKKTIDQAIEEVLAGWETK